MTRSKSCTLSKTETVLKHEYNFSTKQWSQTPVLISIASKPFREGSFRYVYQLRDFSLPIGKQECVAKLNKHEHGQAYFREVEMQAKCKALAMEFNLKPLPKHIDVLMPWVIEFPGRASGHGGNLCLCVEPYLNGKYTKYSNNYGYVSHEDPVPHAFSHWSWESLKGKGLVCDIQGVGDLYTDPQIHSNEGNGVYIYGMGDHGIEGIRRFFSSHRCNDVCRSLGLSPIASSAQAARTYSPPQLFAGKTFSPNMQSNQVSLSSFHFNNNTNFNTPRLALPSTAPSAPSLCLTNNATVLTPVTTFNDYSPASSIGGLSKVSVESGYYTPPILDQTKFQPTYIGTTSDYTTYFPDLTNYQIPINSNYQIPVNTNYQIPVNAFSVDPSNQTRGGFW